MDNKILTTTEIDPITLTCDYTGDTYNRMVSTVTAVLRCKSNLRPGRNRYYPSVIMTSQHKDKPILKFDSHFNGRNEIRMAHVINTILGLGEMITGKYYKVSMPTLYRGNHPLLVKHLHGRTFEVSHE